MPDPRLVAVITAMMLIGGGFGAAARAEFSLAQLQDLERLVLARDTGALWAYIQAHPEVLQGTDPLAHELRLFAEATARGQLDYYAARGVLPPANPVSQAASFTY